MLTHFRKWFNVLFHVLDGSFESVMWLLGLACNLSTNAVMSFVASSIAWVRVLQQCLLK